MRTPVPISSPTPKALASVTKALESGYQSKFRGPQIDYFTVEQPGTVTAAEGNAPLASPQPLHLEHHSSLASLVDKVTMVAERDTLPDVAHVIPRAATDSSLVLSSPKFVADDSVWHGGELQGGFETVTSNTSEGSEASFMCRTSAALERLSCSDHRFIVKGDVKGGDSPLDKRMSM